MSDTKVLVRKGNNYKSRLTSVKVRVLDIQVRYKLVSDDGKEVGDEVSMPLWQFRKEFFVPEESKAPPPLPKPIPYGVYVGSEPAPSGVPKKEN